MPNEKYEFIHIYMPKEMADLIRLTAFEARLSISEVVRRIVLYAWISFSLEGGRIDIWALTKKLEDFLSESNEGGEK